MAWGEYLVLLKKKKNASSFWKHENSCSEAGFNEPHLLQVVHLSSLSQAHFREVLLSPHRCRAFRNLRQWGSFPCCSSPSNHEGLPKAWGQGQGAKIWWQCPANQVTHEGPSTYNLSKVLISLTKLALSKQPVTYKDASLSEPGGGLITLGYEFSDTFMLVHVRKRLSHSLPCSE